MPGFRMNTHLKHLKNAPISEDKKQKDGEFTYQNLIF